MNIFLSASDLQMKICDRYEPSTSWNVMEVPSCPCAGCKLLWEIWGLVCRWTVTTMTKCNPFASLSLVGRFVWYMIGEQWFLAKFMLIQVYPHVDCRVHVILLWSDFKGKIIHRTPTCPVSQTAGRQPTLRRWTRRWPCWDGTVYLRTCWFNMDWKLRMKRTNPAKEGDISWLRG